MMITGCRWPAKGQLFMLVLFYSHNRDVGFGMYVTPRRRHRATEKPY